METDARQPNPNKKAASGKRGRTVLLCLLGFLLALGTFLAWLYRGVSPVIRWEYGEGMPPTAAFCEAEDAEYLISEDRPDLGAHVIRLLTAGRTVPCLLIVEDTVAPTAYPVDLDFPAGYEASTGSSSSWRTAAATAAKSELPPSSGPPGTG